MNYDTEEFIAPAFAVIAKTDPVLYARMQASPWQVHVISTFGEQSFTDYAISHGAANAIALGRALTTAFGATITDGATGKPADLTFINRPATENAASVLLVPVADMLADILVHEFAHEENGTSEAAAFRASTAFARKLGNGAVTWLSQETERITSVS